MDLTGAQWRKSSRSTNNGGACVEIAAVGREARRNADNSGGRTEPAQTNRVLAVRDSKYPDGPKLAFTPAQWGAFTTDIKRDRFDL